MKVFISYLLSNNKSLYAEIAKQKKCGALKVYALARGKKAKSNTDYDIIQILVEKGVVSGYRIIY